LAALELVASVRYLFDLTAEVAAAIPRHLGDLVPAAALARLVGVMPDEDLPAPLQPALREATARRSQAVTRFGCRRKKGQTEAAALPATRASDQTEGWRPALQSKAPRSTSPGPVRRAAARPKPVARQEVDGSELLSGACTDRLT
jgi:hypothetical protein